MKLRKKNIMTYNKVYCKEKALLIIHKKEFYSFIFRKFCWGEEPHATRERCRLKGAAQTIEFKLPLYFYHHNPHVPHSSLYASILLHSRRPLSL